MGTGCSAGKEAATIPDLDPPQHPPSAAQDVDVHRPVESLPSAAASAFPSKSNVCRAVIPKHLKLAERQNKAQLASMTRDIEFEKRLALVRQYQISQISADSIDDEEFQERLKVVSQQLGWLRGTPDQILDKDQPAISQPTTNESVWARKRNSFDGEIKRKDLEMVVANVFCSQWDQL